MRRGAAKTVKPLSAFTPAETATGNCRMLMALDEGSGNHTHDLVTGAAFTPNYLAWDTTRNVARVGASSGAVPTSGVLFGDAIAPQQGFICAYMCDFTLPDSGGVARKVHLGGGGASEIGMQLSSFSLADESGVISDPNPGVGYFPYTADPNTTTDTAGMLLFSVSPANGSNIRTVNGYYSNGGASDSAQIIVDAACAASTANILLSNRLTFGTGDTAALARTFYGTTLIAFPAALPADVTTGMRWMYEYWKVGKRVVPPWWL